MSFFNPFLCLNYPSYVTQIEYCNKILPVNGSDRPMSNRGALFTILHMVVIGEVHEKYPPSVTRNRKVSVHSEL